MQYTNNYRLKKQELTDKADITQINENWDTIDSELATVDGKSGGAITGDVEINGHLSTEGFNTKLDYIKGQTPETPKNATWNIFDSENNRVARVQFNISESGVPSIGMYVNKNNDAGSEDSTGVVCQWNDVTPKVSITHNPDKAANDNQIATTNWVKSQIATTSEYGLVKLADEQAFLMPKDPEYAINVPLTYKVNGFRRLNTAYEVGDRVACAFKYDLYLECTQAGTTSEEMLDTRNVTHGQVINDGSVQWTVKTHIRSINNTTADVNGNIQIGAGASEDKIKKIVLDLFFPIGSVYLSADNDFNPNSSWGGTWVKIENRFLLGSGTRGVGATGGEETHILTESEMPAHTHSGSTSSAGNHSHSRGTIGNDLTGIAEADRLTLYASNQNTSSGVFSWKDRFGLPAGGTGGKQNTSSLRFSGSSGFTGSVSYAGDHSHSMSLNNTGGNSAHNNMPPFEVVNIWRRVA